MNSELLQAGLPPANDRMLTTCFVAALLHAIIILGVTFSPPKFDANGGAPGLEVILVGDKGPAVAHNRNAKYLAQRNQLGSGNTTAAKRALIPKSSLARADRPGIADGEGLEYRRAGDSAGDDAVIATRGASPTILYLAPAAAAQATSAMPVRLENRPDLGMNPNSDGVALRLRGPARKQLWISADTRESDVAEYLDSWRRRVERVGTMNFPSAARLEKASGTPVVEVTIDADGKLARAIVRRSSGRPGLDDAAIRILQLAAPFEPFPRKMSATHDQIRIAYQWEFLSGTARGSSVLYSAPDEPAATR